MCKKFKFDHSNKFYMYNPASALENDTHINSSGTLTYTQNDSPNLGQKTRPHCNQQQKQRTCEIVDFVVPADHRIKLKESEKKDEYLDLARELKKKTLWNMNVSIIPIMIGAFGTVTKLLLKRLEDLEVRGQVENIQTTAFLRTAQIPRRVLETWGDLLSHRLQWKTVSQR